MWRCFHEALCCFAKDKPLSRSKAEGGGYDVVGKRLNLGASTVATHCEKAEKLFKTEEGREEYFDWLRKEWLRQQYPDGIGSGFKQKT